MRSRVGWMLSVVLVAASGCGSDSGGSDEVDVGSAPLTLAVIGDTPYGDPQEAQFPRLVQAIDADADVDVVLHLGDIKTGGSSCDERRFKRLRRLFDTFEDPVVYTPGDNEWTDCHRKPAGGYVPTERLAVLRRVFFKRPRRSIGGRPMKLTTQAREPGFKPFVENVSWTNRGVVFSTLHVVGSDNDRTPWFDGRETPAQAAQRRAEFDARLAADLAWLDRTFQQARRSRARAVVLGMQADMFTAGNRSGAAKIVARLSERARAFRGPVLLLNGDTHQYLTDRPLPEAPNVTRIVVQGATAGEWLRLDIDPQSQTFFSYRRRRVG